MAILEKRGGPFALTFSIFRFWRYLKQNRGVWISGRLVGWGPKMAGQKNRKFNFADFANFAKNETYIIPWTVSRLLWKFHDDPIKIVEVIAILVNIYLFGWQKSGKILTSSVASCDLDHDLRRLFCMDIQDKGSIYDVVAKSGPKNILESILRTIQKRG